MGSEGSRHIEVVNTRAGSAQASAALLRTRRISELIKFSHAACRTDWFRLDELVEGFTLADCVNQRRAILGSHANVEKKQGVLLKNNPHRRF